MAMACGATGLMRRFVYLMTRGIRQNGQRLYTMRRINMSRLFYPTPPPSNGHGYGLEYAPLPAACQSFCAPESERHSGDMDFMLLARDKIMSVDRTGRTSIYEDRWGALRSGPSFCKAPVDWPISVPADDGSLYVLNSNGCFQVLVHGLFPVSEDLPNNFLQEDWTCQVLPPAPLPSDAEFDAYTVVGGDTIWMSTEGEGTYSFDMARRTWEKKGDWEMPFFGLAEYVPEHKLWFGFSKNNGNGNGNNPLCAIDLAGASADLEPVLCNIFEQDVKPPKEWFRHLFYMLHLGSGRFCIARGFAKEVGEWPHETKEYFAVLTAVEVVRNDEQLKMVKHKSVCYSLGRNRIHRVL